MDGGLATQLEAQGADLATTLWSAQLLIDDPAAVIAAHRAFFAAGAQIATTASYQAPTELATRSVDLAREALAEFDDGRARWVAGSVGPYGAALADGSEYRGDYALSVAELRAWHRPRIAALAEAGVDVLALETIPCLAEVEALLAEVAGTGVPCWLSLTCAGERTRAGEPAYAGFAMARDVEEVVAVGVNCLDPAEVGVAGPAGRSREWWQARRRVPEQRRDLGSGTPPLDRAGTIRPGSRPGLGRRRRPAGRRLLPGHPRRHPRALGESAHAIACADPPKVRRFLGQAGYPQISTDSEASAGLP